MSAFRRSCFFLAFLFLVLVLSEARFESMDGITVHESSPVRALVGTLALREYGSSDDGVDRVLRIDPGNVRAWERRCTAFLGLTQTEWISDCQQALKLETTGANYRRMGSAQEQANQFCAAEASYQAAVAQRDLEPLKPFILRDEARAALGCGDPATSLQVLHDAEAIDRTAIDNASLPEETSQARDALASDHGYMAAVYEEMNEPQKAREMCFAANPGYIECSCKFTGTGLVCSSGAPQNVTSIR